MKYISLLLLLFFSFLLSAQNLVSNGSFEMSKKCPHFLNQLGLVKGWSSPTISTPDYFSMCCTSVTASVPQNEMGIQMPKTGGAYVGLILFQHADPDRYREYITTQLKQPLEKGKEYLVKFYVCLAEESEIAISNIEVLFSKEPIKSIGAGRLDFVPQLSYKANKPVTDTAKWTEISWNYKAKGKEEYMVIGNFTKGTKCLTQSVPSKLPGTFLNAYYYIDDVCVEEIKDTTPCKCIEDTLPVKPHPLLAKRPGPPFKAEDTIVGSLIIKPDQNIVLELIYFETNKSDLLPDSFKQLSDLAGFLSNHPTYKIAITGHTDSTGNEQLNIKLSENRAKAVADYLASKGIDKNNITSKGAGSADPVADNKTTEGKAKNRRVEFKISEK
jgi:OOP family OmpA-OmpF porin